MPCDAWNVMFAVWRLACDVWNVMCAMLRMQCDVWNMAYALWCLLCDVCDVAFAMWCWIVTYSCDVLQFDMCIVTLAAWFVVHKVMRICSQYICVQWDTKNLFSHVFTHNETNLPEGTAISQLFFVLNVIYYYSPIRTFVALVITSESPFLMRDQTIASLNHYFWRFFVPHSSIPLLKSFHMLLLPFVLYEDSVRDFHVCFWARVFTYLYWSNSGWILADLLSMLRRWRAAEIYSFHFAPIGNKNPSDTILLGGIDTSAWNSETTR